MHITLDRSKIMSVGVPAVAKFLKALQVCEIKQRDMTLSDGRWLAGRPNVHLWCTSMQSSRSNRPLPRFSDFPGVQGHR